MNLTKKTFAIISLLLLLTIVIPLFALPNVNASTPPKTWPTVAYLSVAPNPIGVGQRALFIMWLDKANPLVQGIYGQRFTGYTLNITKPNGETQIMGPYQADAISSAAVYFTPDQVGNYTAVFNFPAQVIREVNPPPAYQTYNHPDQINDTYAASVSNTVTLVVTDKPVANFPEAPLPTDYWTGPINALNRGWSQIAGDWLGGAQIASSINPATTGPETAHVLWTRSFGIGGIAGENNEASVYLSTGSSSVAITSSPIIVNGILVLADKDSLSRNWGWYAVNLNTGKTLYYINGTTLPYPSFASVQTFDSESVHGSWAYLWSISGTTWTALDPNNGEVVFIITNAPSSGTAVHSANNGAILRYNLVNLGNTSNPKMYLQVWNTTLVTSPISATGDPTRPYSYSGTYDGSKGYSLNASIPNVPGSILSVVEDHYVIGGTEGVNNSTGPVVPGNIWKLSLVPGQEGTLIENISFTPPPFFIDPSQYYYYGPYNTVNQQTGAVVGSTALPAEAMIGPLVFPDYNVFIYWQGSTRQFWGFDLTTGRQMWGPTDPQDPWMTYGMDPTVYNGMLLASRFNQQSPGGEITAYNITTGQLIWKYLPGTVNFETFYSNVPTAISAIADGKIYTVSEEHSPSMPLRRDATITCLNASTGNVIWQIPHYMRSQLAISRGYLIGGNLYDNNWYCFGKGPSATTVAGPDTVQPLGTKILLTGTVTDQSPGAPNTAAISDADQEAWMEYLYMQQSMPFNVTGVPVSLNALDPNGNFVPIGTAASDASGKYSIAFTPQVSGEYTIVASFTGSKSYGSSSGETAISISVAASPTNTPTPAPQSMADIYFLPVSIAIIIAIIVVGIVLSLLLLRKRP